MAVQACGLLATNEETVVAKGRFTTRMSLQIGEAIPSFLKIGELAMLAGMISIPEFYSHFDEPSRPV